MTRTIGECETCGARVFRVVHLTSDEIVVVDELPVAGGNLLLTSSRTAYGDEIAGEFTPGGGYAYQPHTVSCAANVTARARAARVDRVKAYLSQGMARHRPITIRWAELDAVAGELVDMLTRALPMSSRLYKRGDWLSDGHWLAHRSLSLFGRVFALCGPLPGVYELGPGGATFMATLKSVHFDAFDNALACDLVDAGALYIAPEEHVEFDPDHGALGWPPDEPWAFFNADSPRGFTTFDGRIASAASLFHDEWWWRLGRAQARWLLVGGVGDERLFALVQMSDGVPA